jgi:putative glutamine amidotransferase
MSARCGLIGLRPVIGITTDVDDKNFKLSRQYADAVEDAGACPVLLVPSNNISEIITKIDGLLISGGDDLHPSYYNETFLFQEGLENNENNPPSPPFRKGGMGGFERSYKMKIVDRKRSDFELSLIREIIKPRMPVLGICYGMQLINVAFGGSLYQDIKAQLPLAIDHKKNYHMIKVRDNDYIPAGEFKVNSSHHQAIKVEGQGLKTVAISGDNIIEAICMDDYPFFLGVQWHPERLKDKLSVKIFKSLVEASGGGR